MRKRAFGDTRDDKDEIVGVLNKDTLEYSEIPWRAEKTVDDYVQAVRGRFSAARALPVAVVLYLSKRFPAFLPEEKQHIIDVGRHAFLATGATTVRVPGHVPAIQSGVIQTLNSYVPGFPASGSQLIMYGDDVMHQTAAIQRAIKTFPPEIYSALVSSGYLEKGNRKARETFSLQEALLARRVFDSPAHTLTVFVAEQQLRWAATLPTVHSAASNSSPMTPPPTIPELLYAYPTLGTRAAVHQTVRHALKCHPVALASLWPDLVLSDMTTQLLAEAARTDVTPSVAINEMMRDARDHLPKLTLTFGNDWDDESRLLQLHIMLQNHINAKGENVGKLMLEHTQDSAIITLIQKALAAARSSLDLEITDSHIPRKAAAQLLKVVLAVVQPHALENNIPFQATLSSVRVGAAALKVIVPDNLLLRGSTQFVDGIAILKQSREITASATDPAVLQLYANVSAIVGTATPRELYSAATNSPACVYLVQALFHTTLLNHFQQRFPHIRFRPVAHPQYNTVMGGTPTRPRKNKQKRLRRKTVSPRRRRRSSSSCTTAAAKKYRR
jgi:hypothetical protein